MNLVDSLTIKVSFCERNHEGNQLMIKSINSRNDKNIAQNSKKEKGNLETN